MGRTTPQAAIEEDQGCSSLTLCHAGTPNYRDGRTRLTLAPGQILMNPRQGGIVSTGYLSSINFPIEHGRLRRTIRAMKGTPDQLNLNQPLLMGAPRGTASPCDGGLFAFFSFLETLLQQSRWIGNSLGLDEQLYRLVALALFQSQGLMADMQKRWSAGPPRRNTLDPLVDYIRAHAHCNLTLTDLEEQSHYSAVRVQGS